MRATAGVNPRPFIDAGKTTKILSFIRRIGMPTAILIVSVVLSILSVSIASVTHYITNDPIGYTGLINTALIPFILGVPTLIILLGVLRELEQTREELARLSTYDVLTGTLNRRCLLERGEAVCSSIGARQCVAVALIDADFFKNINDEHGHMIGDATLRCLASTIEGNLPENAFCGRFGGEEFAVVMPGHDEKEALALANKLREDVASACALIDAVEVNATISIGLALSDHPSVAMDALLSAADVALYEAKGTGRNRVCLAESPIG